MPLNDFLNPQVGVQETDKAIMKMVGDACKARSGLHAAVQEEVEGEEGEGGARYEDCIRIYIYIYIYIYIISLSLSLSFTSLYIYICIYICKLIYIY